MVVEYAYWQIFFLHCHKVKSGNNGECKNSFPCNSHQWPVIENKYSVFAKLNEWMNEWMNECCLTPTQQFFSYHGENKLIFNEMMMKSTELDF